AGCWVLGAGCWVLGAGCCGTYAHWQTSRPARTIASSLLARNSIGDAAMLAPGHRVAFTFTLSRYAISFRQRNRH
ncbi:MAG: hypothetical protein ABI613_02050, partial [Gemmatimonadota bacterium]